MRRTNVDMLSGSIVKGLLSMTLPVMVMNVMASLFNIVDMTVLRIFADDRAVGAVGACGTLITLCTSLLIGMSVGANVIVARRIGSGDKEHADRAVMTSILLSIVSGIVLMVVGIVFAQTFLEMTNCHESLLPQATTYFGLYFLGSPIYMFYVFAAAILRATGDTKNPMYFTIAAGITKVLCTLFFTAVMKFGVVGVGIATIVSNTVAAIMSIYVLLKAKNTVCVDFRKLKFDFSALKDILFIGLPAGLQSALYSFANTVIATAVNTFGADATTGISIANQFDGLLYQICHSPSIVVAPYVAQNIGAKNVKRAKQSLLWAVVTTVSFGATFGSLSAIFSKELSSLMSSTPAVIAYSQQKMIIISSTYFLCGIYEVLAGVLRGMSKPIIPLISTLVFMCLLRFVWVYAIFPYYPNLTFLYTVWPVGWVLSIITLFIAYRCALPKLQRACLVEP